MRPQARRTRSGLRARPIGSLAEPADLPGAKVGGEARRERAAAHRPLGDPLGDIARQVENALGRGAIGMGARELRADEAEAARPLREPPRTAAANGARVAPRVAA